MKITHSACLHAYHQDLLRRHKWVTADARVSFNCLQLRAYKHVHASKHALFTAYNAKEAFIPELQQFQLSVCRLAVLL
jgi:hypothetical protein